MPMGERYFNRKLTLDEKLYIAGLLMDVEDDPEFHPAKIIQSDEPKEELSNEHEGP